MKFSVERDNLLRAIQTAGEIIASRTNMSILSNVLINADDSGLLIRATDLKVSFETHVDASVVEAGATTVFCDKLLGILRSLPSGEVGFEQNTQSSGENMVIRPQFKNIDFTLRSIPADKFPEVQTRSTDSYFGIAQDELSSMITQTVFAVSDDETRFFMNGVFLESVENALTMVATDGRRLSFIKRGAHEAVPSFDGVIIPPKVLNLVRKLASGEGEFQLAIADAQVFFAFEHHSIGSALIDGQFPNYRRVIPEKQEHQLVVSRDELQEALKRVSLLVEKSRRIYVDLSEGHLELRSEESEVGVAREDLPVEYNGPDMTIALNYMYLFDPLKVMECDNVELAFTQANRAITLRPVPEADYFHIIMPMQIQ